MPYKNGWSDERSHLSKKTVNNKQQIIGTFWLNDIEFRFRINEQNPLNAYPYRGQITAIASDGKIMQLRGAQKTERLRAMDNTKADGIRNSPGKRNEALNVATSVNLKFIDDEDKIKAIIAKKAEQLYGENIYTISQLQREPAGPLMFAFAVRLHSKGFFKRTKGNITEKTQRACINDLARCGAILDECPMAELRRLDVKRLHKALSGSADKATKTSEDAIRRKLRLAARFWQYCREEGLFQAAGNPFSDYLEDSFSKKASIKKLQKDAVTPKVLSTEIERKINEAIEDKVEDGRYMGIAIIKDAYFPIAEACSLTWKDILFDESFEDYVRIVRRRDSIAGATHDYTRPCFPFCAICLRRRHEYLLERYSADELRDMPVVSTCKNPKQKLGEKGLSGFCKSILRSSGMSGAQLEKHKDFAQTGVGTAILLRNHKYKLTNYCGLSKDTAAISFLTGHSLRGDTTGDHYRSFTAPEGQWYLYVALSRDTRFTSFSESHREETRIGGRIILRPSKPERQIGAVIKLTLKKGERVEIHTLKGVEGNIRVQR